jgi:hypothetical protein
VGADGSIVRRGSRLNRTRGEVYLVAGTSPLADRAVLCRFFASPDFGLRGKPVVVVGDPEHDRFGRSVFHAVGKRPHFLAPLAPVIWAIGEQPRRRRVIIGHGKERKRRKLHSELAHSESRRTHLPPLAVRCSFGSTISRDPKEDTAMAWTTPVLVEICIGLEINGYMPVDGYVPPEF